MVLFILLIIYPVHGPQSQFSQLRHYFLHVGKISAAGISGFLVASPRGSIRFRGGMLHFSFPLDVGWRNFQNNFCTRKMTDQAVKVDPLGLAPCFGAGCMICSIFADFPECCGCSISGKISVPSSNSDSLHSPV